MINLCGCPSCALYIAATVGDASDHSIVPPEPPWVLSTSPAPNGNRFFYADSWAILDIAPPSAAVKVIVDTTSNFDTSGSPPWPQGTARVIVGWLDENNYLWLDLVGEAWDPGTGLPPHAHLAIGKRVAGVDTTILAGSTFARGFSNTCILTVCLQQIGGNWVLSASAFLDALGYYTGGAHGGTRVLSAAVPTPPGDRTGLMGETTITDNFSVSFGELEGSPGYQLDKIDDKCPCSVQSSSGANTCCCHGIELPSRIYMTLRVISSGDVVCAAQPDVIDFPLDVEATQPRFWFAGDPDAFTNLFWDRIHFVAVVCGFFIFDTCRWVLILNNANGLGSGFNFGGMPLDLDPGSPGQISCAPLHVKGRFTVPAPIFGGSSSLICGTSFAPTTFEIEITE